MNKYKAIIYDIDGTILNTLNMNMYPLLQIIKEETGETWSFNQVLKFAAYPGMKVMEELKVKDQKQHILDGSNMSMHMKKVQRYMMGLWMYLKYSRKIISNRQLYLPKHTNSMK